MPKPRDPHVDAQHMPLAHTLAPIAPHENDPRDPVRRWEALVDAGLIGHQPPRDPAVDASLLAADALFRRIARDRRSAR